MAQQADQADVPRGGKKCPTCNTRLVHSSNPLICSCCKAEYHKNCSGLTRHALAAWVASRLWTCATCTCWQHQTDTDNLPQVDAAYGRLGTSSRRNLKVIQWNVDGLATSMVDLQGLVRDDPDIDFLMIQETKLLPSNSDPYLPGYSVVRRDRPAPVTGGGPRGGGLLTFVKEDIPFRLVKAYQGNGDEGLEALAVEIQLSHGGRFTLVNVYRPPNRLGGQGPPSFDHIRVPVTPFLMAGDWNAHAPLLDDHQPSNSWGEALEEWEWIIPWPSSIPDKVHALTVPLGGECFGRQSGLQFPS